MSGSDWKLDPEEIAQFVKDRDDKEARSLEKFLDKCGGSIEGIAEALKSDPKTGLTETDFEQRKAQFGVNNLPTKPPEPYWRFLLEALSDRTLIILAVASIVSIILGVALPPPGETRSTGWIEGTAILIAVVIVSNVTAGNDFSKDRKFRKLSQSADAERKASVIRKGETMEILVPDILTGDIVLIEAGNYIAADMLVLRQESLSVDESSLTGEPDQVPKNKENPWLLSGTLCASGSGLGLVIAVGPHSLWGKIKATLEKGENETPLQAKLEGMAENIGKLGVIAAIITLVGLILKWSIESYGIHKVPWHWSELGRLVQFVITAITIIVVAVPEGLPLAVTLALAYSMLQMMKDQNLVRHLAACETMGGATQICSDKTGTLTKNEMTVIKLKTGSINFDNFPQDYNKKEINKQVQHLITEGVCINSTAYIEKDDKSEKPKFVGLKTECALLVMSDKLGVSYKEVREAIQPVAKYPFSSKKKRMSTLLKTETGYRLYCKGASEVLVDLCDTYLDDNGNQVDISEKREEMKKMIDEWAGEGYRTLSLAYRELPADLEIPKVELKKKDEGEKGEPSGDDGVLDKNLILIALVGIEDPVRDEVPDAVGQCQRAGITVRMLTGDNILTASKIAKSCGILKDDGVAIEGPKFRKLSVPEIDELIPKLQVIARCSPEDKLILVKRLRDLGEVVAVTGDGTNDAPILREADVGFAMGISGTEVAKDASDIVLLDDNFSSIKKAVMWGRNVYDAIRKFLQFQLTVNIVAVLVALLGAITTGESPLTAVQLLWVNLLMDTMAALALATERPTEELLNRPPQGRYSPLINPKMWRMIIVQAVFQLGILLFTLYGAWRIPFLEISGGSGVEAQYDEDGEIIPPDLHRSTIVFNTFVFCQIFNEINCRKLGDEVNILKGIHKNYIFIAVIVFSVAIQIIMVTFGGAFVKTVSLDIYQWLFCLIIGFVSIPLGIASRFIPAPEEKIIKFKPKVEKTWWRKLLRLDQEEEEATIVDPEDRQPRSAAENWKLAREALLSQRKPGLVELIRKTHNRGSVQFGRSPGTRSYTFMEF